VTSLVAAPGDTNLSDATALLRTVSCHLFFVWPQLCWPNFDSFMEHKSTESTEFIRETFSKYCQGLGKGYFCVISMSVVVRTRRASALCSLNLNWFSAFDFMMNLKYVFDRKFTQVYACQNLSK